MPPKKYRANEGDCLFSIAARNGLPLDKLLRENRELLDKRGEPGILSPGDVVTIPEKEDRQEQCGTDQRHTFKRKFELCELRIKIEEFGQPRSNEPYWLLVGDKRVEGETPETDDEGLAIVKVPPTLERALLIIGKDEDEYELLIGHLDPVDTVTGIHGRLENMGYDPGGVKSPYDEESANAMGEFLDAEKGEEDDDSDLSDWQSVSIKEKVKKHYGS